MMQIYNKSCSWREFSPTKNIEAAHVMHRSPQYCLAFTANL